MQNQSGPPRSTHLPRRRAVGTVLWAIALLGVAACSTDSESSTTDTPEPTSQSTDEQSSGDSSSYDPNGDLPYADTGWVTLHGDAGNRKYQPTASPAERYEDWQALAHQSVLTAPSTGNRGELFVTTGQAEGSANLHAFDPDGNLLWESEPWSGTTGVDSCAVISTAIVDTDGDLYVSDCDQVWAFHPDGQIKWVTPLPPAPAGSPLADNPLHPNNFVTAVFTLDGHVLGVTLFGQVVALDRDSGELAFEPFLLPSVPSTVSTDPPLPPTVWSDGEMDPLFTETMWQIIFGGTVVSANTPAVSSETGRVFVVAGGSDPDSGVLYGLDIDAGTAPGVEIAFSTPVGVGSGCSPSMSPDNESVYTCDAAGNLYSVAAESGEINWTADARSEAGSVAIGPEGTIYVLIKDGGTYAAYDPEGNKLWDADFSTLEDPLPENPGIGPKTLVGGGNPTVIAEGKTLLVALSHNYQYPVAGRTPNVPIVVEMVDLDTSTGVARRSLAKLANPTEGILAARPDGTIISTQGGVITTSLAPIAPAVDAQLTEGLEVLPAGGGIQVFRPLD